MRQPGEAPGERGELPRRRRSNEDADSVEAMVDSSEDEQNTLRENEAEPPPPSEALSALHAVRVGRGDVSEECGGTHPG